jgi:hypothetical protein
MERLLHCIVHAGHELRANNVTCGALVSDLMPRSAVELSHFKDEKTCVKESALEVAVCQTSGPNRHMLS